MACQEVAHAREDGQEKQKDNEILSVPRRYSQTIASEKTASSVFVPQHVRRIRCDQSGGITRSPIAKGEGGIGGIFLELDRTPARRIWLTETKLSFAAGFLLARNIRLFACPRNRP